MSLAQILADAGEAMMKRTPLLLEIALYAVAVWILWPVITFVGCLLTHAPFACGG